MATVYVNDVTIETYGLTVTAIHDWASGVKYDYPQTTMPGYVGVLLGTAPTAPARVIQLEGLIDGADAATRNATLQTLYSRLTGTVRLRFTDGSSKEIPGVLVDKPVRPLEMSGGFSLPLVATLTFLCPDPSFRDTADTTKNLTASPLAIPCGTLPGVGTITITGAATNPAVVYKNSAGTEVSRMSFTVSLGAGETLTVDCGAQTVVTSKAGVTNPLDLWTSGDFLFPSCVDGTYATSSWPTLEVTSGTATYVYRRRWES